MATKTTDLNGNFSEKQHSFLKGFMGTEEWIGIMNDLAKDDQCSISEELSDFTYLDLFADASPELAEKQKFVKEVMSVFYPETFTLSFIAMRG